MVRPRDHYPIDVCPDVDGDGRQDAVTSIQVVDSATQALLAEKRSPTSALARSSVGRSEAIGRLVHVETIPGDWRAESTAMSHDGEPYEHFATTASTVHAGRQIAGGSFTLTKVLKAERCQPGVVQAEVYLDNGVDGDVNWIFEDPVTIEVEIFCGDWGDSKSGGSEDPPETSTVGQDAEARCRRRGATYTRSRARRHQS